MTQKKSRIKKILLRTLTILAVIGLLLFLAFKFSPYPSALSMRYLFEREAVKMNEKLAEHVPEGVSEILDIQYDTTDDDAKLDVYFPSNVVDELPVIVWVHGGGWISGKKNQLSNYYKILASNGYIVASIDYSLAPEKTYPTPVKQTMAALRFIQENAGKYHINPSSIFLGGDSAGSHIAAQVATILSVPTYAETMGITPSIDRSDLKGMVLYCGPYDAEGVDIDGAFGAFLKAMLWSYSGKDDFLTDEFFQTASVIDYVDKNFPPSFISVGNNDPLEVQSKKLARKLSALQVETDTLFFAADYTPKLPHEYQFNLDEEAGKTALERSFVFLKNNQ